MSRAKFIASICAGSLALGCVAFAAVISSKTDQQTQPSTSVVRATVSAPPIITDFIRYSPKRKHQMAAYSARHYHQRTWHLNAVRQIILHYTVIPTYRGTHDLFNSNATGAADAATRNESPGACTHFVVDKDGQIYQQVPLSVMCRSVIGLNNRTMGIEFVEETSASNILRRPKQLQAGLALVRWLQSTYAVANRDVIGHAMANKSRFFVDYEHWFNDHEDWQTFQVRSFRSRL